MMNKRFVVAIVVLLFALSLLPTEVHADSRTESDVIYPVTGGNLYFRESTGEIVNCDISVTSAEIPPLINGVAVTSIGDDAFHRCRSLTSISIPNSVTSIGWWAFYDCNRLANVSIPEGVTTIGGWAFGNCNSLVWVRIPSSVSSIGEEAFSGCSRLTNIQVDLNNAVFSSRNGVLFDKEQSTLICYPPGKDGFYSIPDSVNTIGKNAFFGCWNLYGVDIPGSVTRIEPYSFYGCMSLTSITIPSSVTTIGDCAFANCHDLTDVQVDDSNTTFSSFGGALFDDTRSVLLCVPAGKTDEYRIPSGVTSIGNNAFHCCEALTGIWIPSGVTTVGDSAFYGCSGLTSLSIPNSVTTAEDFAFASCTQLTSIRIPGSLTVIGDCAFNGCDSLSDVYYGGTEELWDWIIIDKGNESLTDAMIHFINQSNGLSHESYYAEIYDITISGREAITHIYCEEGETTTACCAFYGIGGQMLKVETAVLEAGELNTLTCAIPNETTQVKFFAINSDNMPLCENREMNV